MRPRATLRRTGSTLPRRRPAAGRRGRRDVVPAERRRQPLEGLAHGVLHVARRAARRRRRARRAGTRRWQAARQICSNMRPLTSSRADHGARRPVAEAERAELVVRVRAVEARHGGLDELVARRRRAPFERGSASGRWMSKMARAPRMSGRAHGDLDVGEPLEQRRVDQVLAVGRGDDGDVGAVGEAVELGQQRGEELVAVLVGGAAADASDRLDLVQEQDGEAASRRLARAPRSSCGCSAASRRPTAIPTRPASPRRSGSAAR